MKEISKYFNIDYVFQVCFDNKNRQIPSLENIIIVERNKFINFVLKSEEEFTIIQNSYYMKRIFLLKRIFLKK